MVSGSDHRGEATEAMKIDKLVNTFKQAAEDFSFGFVLPSENPVVQALHTTNLYLYGYACVYGIMQNDPSTTLLAAAVSCATMNVFRKAGAEPRQLSENVPH
jgi:hypothetical protein